MHQVSGESELKDCQQGLLKTARMTYRKRSGLRETGLRDGQQELHIKNSEDDLRKKKRKAASGLRQIWKAKSLSV
jgi:hypothetical protein